MRYVVPQGSTLSWVLFWGLAGGGMAGCENGYQLNKDLAVSAAALTFEAASIGESSDQTLTLKNTGLSTIRFEAATLSLSNPFEFKGGAFPGSGGDCDQPLGKGKSCSMILSHKPRWPLPYAGTLSITFTYLQAGKSRSARADIAVSASTLAGEVLDSGNCSNTQPVYTPGAIQTPGGRRGFAHCQDSAGNLYVFGGHAGGNIFADLWKWDGSAWSHLSGTKATGVAPGPVLTVFGAGGRPGYLNYAECAVNSSGHVYLYGGEGYDEGNTTTSMDTLWRWDGSSWTQLWGTATNVGASPNSQAEVSYVGTVTPGARTFSHVWFDSSDRFHVWGGSGYGVAHATAVFADMFLWTGSGWQYEGGSQTANQNGGNCGGAACTLSHAGQGGAGFFPSARRGAFHGVDAQGNFWLGYGNGAAGRPEDLWKYDGSLWTYVYGTFATTDPVWGTKGVAASSNRRGSMHSASTGNASHRIIFDPIRGQPWMFGGYMYQTIDSVLTYYAMGDLWSWVLSGAAGTPVWMGGQSGGDKSSIRGAYGAARVSSIGARYGHAFFIDKQGYPSAWGGYDQGGSCDEFWRF